MNLRYLPFFSGLLTLLLFANHTQAQVDLTVTVNSGSSGTSCTDGAFGGGPEPQWRVNIAGQGFTTYPSAGICFTNPPNQQYNETFNCPSDYPATIQVCFRAFEDDGAACIVSQSCQEDICQNFATPAPGTSVTYTLSIPNNGTNQSWGTVNFTLNAVGGFNLPGSANNLICNAINLGTLNANSSIGNDNLSNYGNYCADNASEPNPWGGDNDQGVWFQFTTGPTPSTTIRFNAVSDPQGLGDAIDLQLALYESSNGTCTGALSLIDEDYQGLGTLYDEEMDVECLQPNTTYFLLVDGEDSGIPFTDGQQGFFGLEIYDQGITQAGDQICQATPLGTVPAGGSVGTPNLSQSNICATNTGDPTPGNWSPDQTVWYSFVAPPSGHVIINADSDLPFPIGTDAVDLQLALYESSNNTCTGTLTEVDSDYDPIIFGEDLDVRCLDPGRIYYIMVDGSGLNVDGIFDIAVDDGGILPASNDEICNAIPLGAPVPNGTVGLNNQNNFCADNLFEPIPSNWGNDQGVWYTFVAPPSGKVEIRLDNVNLLSDQIDLQVAVYDASNQNCTDPLTELASEHDGIGILWDEDMEVECLIPGRTYYIMVDGEGSIINPDLQEGEFDIEVWADPRDPAAPNDDVCNAIPLGDPTGSPVGTTPITSHGSQNNFCATATGEPNPSGFTPNQTVWYTFTAPSTGNVNIFVNSDAVIGGTDPIDIEVAVWESTGGGCAGPWLEVQSGDDLLGYDLDMDVNCLTPGQTYYIQLDGSDLLALVGSDEGYFDLTLTELPTFPIAPNDDICNAVPLGDPFASGSVGITNQNNLCADDIGDPNPSAFGTDQTVWYTFTTPATGGPYAVDVSATTGLPWPFGSGSIDLQVAVFESSNGTCTGTMTEVESDYDPIIFDEDVTVQCLLPNTTYYVMIDGSFFDVQGYFDLNITPATSVPIPPNDLICNAVNLGAVPVGGSINNNVNYSNFCADTEPGEPSPFGIDQTVWFSFTAPNHAGANTSSEVTIQVESDPNGVGDAVDLQLAVYESSNGTCTGNMSLLENGSDNPTFSFDADVSVTCLNPGATYWVQVDGSAINVEGYFTIEVIDDGAGTFPTNDDICNATPLGAVPNGGSINNNVNYNNFCATTEPGEPNPSAFGIDETVWFTFTAPASGNVTIDLESDPNNQGDDPNLQVGVWYSPSGACTGPWLEAGSDYDGILFDESLSLECLIPGATYYVQVDATDAFFGDDEGYFTIEISDDGGTTNFPYNNDICNAYNFGQPGGTFAVLATETNVCANVQLGEPGLGSYAEHTVWYQFIAPPSGRVEIEVESNNAIFGVDPEVYVFGSSNNTCTGAFSQVESSNLPTAIITENIEATCLIPGNTYFIQVDGSNLVDEGEFTIRVRDMEPLYGTGLPGDPEPANNLCSNAISIPVQPESCANGNGSWNMYNYGQPTGTFTPSCGQNCGETWYTFTMPASGVALIEGNDDDIGSGFPLGDFSDLHVAAYSGTCGSLTPIDCDGGGFTDDVGFEVSAPPGTQIFLQVFNDGGDDDNEDYELCVSEGCGADHCLNAVANPIQPNIPYCFNTAAATGENISGGEPGYNECGEGDNPENSIYYYFVSDCNGSAVTLSVINATASGGCLLGTVPDDGFNISFFQDSTPCDNNPAALVDCQNFNSCMTQPINWSFTYTNLQPNTPYIIQIDGGFSFLGGDNSGEIMIQTTTNPVVVPTTTPVTCSGNNDGTATATTVGGVAPFTFEWSNGATDSIATGLAPGTYTVTVTSAGAGGCFDTATVNIDPAVAMTASITSVTDETCGNACDGTASVNAVGGTTPYSYLWDVNASGQTTATATGLCAGTYIVTVSDNGTCSDTAMVTIGSPPPIFAAVDSTTDALCNGICDGTGTVSASGGTVTTGYSYAWPTGDSTQTATGLCVGDYNVTIADNNGCFDTVTVSIEQPPGLVGSIANQTNIDCNGNTNGAVEVLAINGTPGYTYNIGVAPVATNIFSNLAAGTYVVTVTDANGCFDTVGVNITEPLALNAQLVTSIDVTCNGGSDGSLTVSATGGTAPYEYSIDGINFFSTTTFNNLLANNYTITVRDSLGCIATTNATINEPIALGITLDGQTVAGCGVCDGTASITPTGGAGGFTYQWSNGEIVQDAQALCSGTNFVTVTDANGCTATQTVTIGNSSALAVNTTIDQTISCAGDCDGQISITPAGGTAPFNFVWSNGNTTSTASALCAGSYVATVTDNNGCFVVENINLTEPTPLTTLAAETQAVSCNGNNDGQGVATPSGGTIPYSFSWDNGETTQTATALTAGPHVVVVTDANGCTANDTAVITEPAPFSVVIVDSTASDCGSTVCNGTAQIAVTGGVAPYTYLWSNGNTTAAPVDLCPNFNDVTVTDASGCTATVGVNIPSNSTLAVSLLNSTNPACFGDCDGTATVGASGGNTTSPYVFLWDNGATTANLTGLCDGNYRVTVSDIDGCSNAIEVTITEPSDLIATGAVITDYSGFGVSCNGAADGNITVNVTGGTTNYSYNWSTSATTASVSGVAAGTYTVTVVDANACSDTAQVLVTEPTIVTATAAVTSDYNGSPVSCAGATDGAATVTPSGGTGVYSYQWSNGATTSATNGLGAGTHSVTATDENGCFAVATVTLTEPSAVTATTAVDNNISCAGLSDGAATVTASGGTTPYSFSWSTGASTASVNGLAAGVYTATVTDLNGCTGISNITITAPPALQIALDADSVFCTGDDDGSAWAIVNGGTMPYAYNWSNGGNSDTITNLTAGVYNVVVTDANNCSVTGSVVVGEPASAVAASVLSSVMATCNGGSNGSIDADALGGTPNYTYLWSNGATTEDLSGLMAGTYTMTATDARGCSASVTTTITEPSAITVTTSQYSNYNGAAISCPGADDGAIQVNSSGGNTPHTYVWSNGANTQIISDLGPGSYTVTVTDANGCTATSTFSIVEPIPLQANETHTDVFCNGDCDGQIIANAVSGTGTIGINGYEYRILGPGQPGTIFSSQNNFTGLCAGNYTIEVRDGNNCVVLLPVTITEPPALSATSTVTNTSCNGGNDGTATVTAAGGVAPYSYSWSNNQTTATVTGLGAGSHTVTITDDNGCDLVTTVIISEPSAITATVSSTMPNCNNGANGTVTVTAAGGTAPYSYNWSNGQAAATAIGLAPGNYTVTVQDVNGCQTIETVNVGNPTALTVSVSTTDPGCSGTATGTATANPTGGTAPYSYQWSNGQMTATATGLNIGTYSVIVNDANNCQTLATVTISQPSGLAVSATVDNQVSCNGGTDGQATVTATGGSAPYSYNWSNGQSTATITGLTAGSYAVTVSDNNGCSNTANVVITEPSGISLSMSAIDVTCKGGADGSASVGAIGGTPPYNYNWSNNGSGQNISNITAGTYQVTIIDANGCTASSSIIVNEPAQALVGVINTSNALCQGSSTGQLAAVISGGTLAPGNDYSYQWSTGATTDIVSGITAGTYSLTVTDDNGCVLNLSTTVSQSGSINLSLQASVDASCPGEPDGSATVAASGGSGTLTYTWSNGQTGGVATGLSAGIYTVSATDANGCYQTLSLTINEPDPFTVTNNTIDVSCFGENDGSITVTGGSEPLSLYYWDNGQVGAQASNLGAGQYTVSVTNLQQCEQSFTFIVNEPDELVITPLVESTVACRDDQNASINVQVSGGNPNYSYNWSTGANTATINGLAAGIYSVTVMDTKGCEASTDVELTNPAVLDMEFTTNPVTCTGDNNGHIQVNGVGGSTNQGFYEYSLDGQNWQQGDLFPNLTAGIYTLYVRDANGCVIDTMVNIEAADPFFITSLLPGDTTIDYGDTITLSADVNDPTGAIVHWLNMMTQDTIVDSTSTSQYVIVQSPTNRTIYRFVAVSPTGCVADTSMVVDVSKTRVVGAPRAFTPNSDGANDRFFIQATRKVRSVKMFRVYDRWGELVFENAEFKPNDPLEGWDGTFQGKEMNSAIFAWYAEVEFIDGETMTIQGDVTLLR